ncbi:MAG: transglutaminase-like domain-containing protein [Candidatus Omnitrophica bacterium]|nr:transglutaminase-like domain-containing protein [Candidatus Omnitrophota bacterium]
MKKNAFRAAIILAVSAAAILALNVPVTTRQGVDFQIREIRIPLYLKALDFMDRYYNYGTLADRITSGEKSGFGKAVALLKWTKENIRENPGSLPVVDDHAWHIIIRGYGLDDQCQDVFTTLCNREGLAAFFVKVRLPDKGRARCFSLVHLGGGWTVFDAYKGIYFINSEGKPAILKEIENGDWKAVKASPESGSEDYPGFMKQLTSSDDPVNTATWKDSRAAIQSPLRRLFHWLKGDKRQAYGE